MIGNEMDISAEAARLRALAEARPLRLPVNRRVDDDHRTRTADGLVVTYTIQVAPHARIHDVLFERVGRMPDDAECRSWLEALADGTEFEEAPSFPGAVTRRYNAFERAAGIEVPSA